MVSKSVSLECRNRVKLETIEEFNESIFADVYRRASNLVENILKENEQIEQIQKGDLQFDEAEYCNNIVPFLGERGMGKSSAMLSFAFFLKNYDDSVSEQYAIEKASKGSFFVLPKIDAAMLTSQERLLDVVLAFMWNEFEKKWGLGEKRDKNLEETKNKFKDAKHSYELYCGSGKNETQYDMTSVRQLKELATCMNLQNDMKDLVQSFLESMLLDKKNEKYLVITVDDLDMVVGDVDDILEQMRMFLMLPHVIILTTADMRRLFLECKRSFAERMLSQKIGGNIEREQISVYVDLYLAKIFPGNRRIFMPYINSAGEIYVKVGEDIGFKQGNESDKKVSDKELIFALVKKLLNVMAYPFESRRHFFQHTSLRKTVNSLSELIDISKVEDLNYQKSLIISWIRSFLDDYAYDFSGDLWYRLVKELRYATPKSFNEIFVEELYSDMLESRTRVSNCTYGSVMAWLIQDRLDLDLKHDQISYILWSYCLNMLEIATELDAKECYELYTRDIFSSALQMNNRSILNEPMLDKPIVFQRVKFELDWTKKGSKADALTIMRIPDNMKKIVSMFKFLSMTDFNVWSKDEDDYQAYSSEKYEKTDGKNDARNKKYKLALGITKDTSIVGKCSLDNLLNNLIHYQDNFKGYCRNVYQAINQTIEGNKEGLDEKELESLLQQIWKAEESGAQSIFDLLPLSSTEVMYHVIDEIARQSSPSVEEDIFFLKRFVTTIQYQFDSMVGLLQDVEEYYDKLKIHNGEKLSYSDKLDKLNKHYGLFEVSFDDVTYEEFPMKIDSDTTV